MSNSKPNSRSTNSKDSSTSPDEIEHDPSSRELAIDSGLEEVVELWIQDSMHEALRVLRTVGLQYDMSDDTFDKLYKER